MTTTTFATITPYEAMRVRWTRDDCAALERAGVLNYRYELIDGVILRKMPQNTRHARLVRIAMLWLCGIYGQEYVLNQASVRVRRDDDSYNTPEPDVILLNKRDVDLTNAQPMPEDISLLIEIASTTPDYDLGTKAGLYARAGIPEYWVAHLDERVVYVHTNPTPDGKYTRIEKRETETLLPRNAPANAAPLPVSDLLPPIDEAPKE